jgi:hypothetical protein
MDPNVHMVVHGFAVSGVSIVYGFAHRTTLKKYPPPDRRTDLWRAAHSSTAVAGALMIAIGAAYASLDVAPAPVWPLYLFTPAIILTIVTGYAFAAAIGTAALSGHERRGHRWGGTTLNRISWVFYTVAVIACIASSILHVPVLWWLLQR